MADTAARAYANDLLLRAARGETTPHTPVWLMRQAGRSDPEYNRLRQACELPLEDLFRDAKRAAEISLLPQRFGVDAIIYFQDILTPLGPMGAPFVFRPGPILERPLNGPDDWDRLRPYDVAAELPFIPETFARIHEALAGEMPVLGFAGAPLTLALFTIEGKSPGMDCPKGQAAMRDHPEALHALLDRLTDMAIDYLKMQIAAGAAAVQLFESCACMVTPRQYAEFALPYQQRIFSALKGVAPTIVFAREWNRIADLAAAAAGIVSLPHTISIAQARRELGPGMVLQGNLDNRLLAYGPWEEVEAAARACIAEGGHTGHIFNLSHGLLKDTPFDRVLRIVDLVKRL